MFAMVKLFTMRTNKSRLPGKGGHSNTSKFVNPEQKSFKSEECSLPDIYYTVLFIFYHQHILSYVNKFSPTFIYKILNGHTAPNLKAFRFNIERDIAYNLRSRKTDLALPLPKKEFGKRRFSYNGASHWHNLPYEAKSVKSLS